MSAAKTLAASYAVLGLVFGALRAVDAAQNPDAESPIAIIVMSVFVAAVGGFIGTLMLAFAFNAGSALSKGIEIQLEPPDVT